MPIVKVMVGVLVRVMVNNQGQCNKGPIMFKVNLVLRLRWLF